MVVVQFSLLPKNRRSNIAIWVMKKIIISLINLLLTILYILLFKRLICTKIWRFKVLFKVIVMVLSWIGGNLLLYACHTCLVWCVGHGLSNVHLPQVSVHSAKLVILITAIGNHNCLAHCGNVLCLLNHKGIEFCMLFV